MFSSDSCTFIFICISRKRSSVIWIDSLVFLLVPFHWRPVSVFFLSNFVVFGPIFMHSFAAFFFIVHAFVRQWIHPLIQKSKSSCGNVLRNFPLATKLVYFCHRCLLIWTRESLRKNHENNAGDVANDYSECSNMHYFLQHTYTNMHRDYIRQIHAPIDCPRVNMDKN